MSILNRASDGLHNALIVLYKCVLIEGAMPKDKLLALCAPSTVSDGDLARKTLNRWVQLGLFEERDESIAISAEMPRECRDKRRGLVELPRALRRIVLEKANNERLWEAEDNRSGDFTRAVSWMLGQNVYDTEFAGFEEAQNRDIAQFKDESIRAFTTNVRWAGFKDWASFLGFGWTAKYPKNGSFVIDPTVAVRDSLPDVFGKSRELDHKSFFTRLAEELPVVDGGRYRREVEGRIDAETWQAPKSDQVSTSLSRALERLNSAGILTLESRADADKRTLLGQGQTPSRTVSHLLWTGASS